MSNIFTTAPTVNLAKKLGQLSNSDVTKFFEDGFIVVNDVFSRDELEPAKFDTEKLVDDLANKLYTAGKIKNLHKDEGLFQRATLLHQDFPGFSVLLHKLGSMPQGYQALYENDKILNIVEQLVGPNVSANPVWNLRPKTPSNESHDVPWHQDNSYYSVEADESLIITAWIPLLDAVPENGCLQFLRGGHKKGVCAKHQGCWRNTWYVELVNSEISDFLECDPVKDLVTTPVPYGGCVLFNNLTPHRSLPNLSNDIRWSLDLRWQNSDSTAGFGGLKEALKLRINGQPDYKADWEPFNAIDRHKIQHEVSRADDYSEDEFEITLSGPWMLRWPIVHHNIHTAKLVKC